MKKLFFFAAAAFAALSLNAQQIIFTEADIDIDDLNGYVFESDGLQLTCTDLNAKMVVDGNNAYFGDASEQIKFEYRLKSGGKSTSKNCLKLTAPKAGKLYIYARSGSNDATDRNLVVSQFGEEKFNQIVKESDAVEVPGMDSKDPEKMTKVYPVISFDVAAGDIDITYPVGSMNFYGFALGAPVAPQGFENATVDNKAEKLFENGQLVIIKNGVKYNALGAQL